MPASGWLAIGSVVAALVAPGAGVTVVALVAAGLAAAAWGVAHPTSRRSLLAAAIGAAVLVIRLAVAPAPPPVAAAIPEGRGPWLAMVESVGAPRAGSQVATLGLEAKDGVVVAATLPRYPAVEPGARVRVDGAIRPPPEGGYGDYLRRTGVAGTLQSRSLKVLPGSNDAGNVLERLRRHAAAALAAAIPEPEAGLASGIVIGLRDRVDRDLAADFTTVGASHVVAISGWNIAIVAACVAAMCRRFSRRRRAFATAAAIVAYVAFAGASASVVRAAAMAGVVLVARESGRAGRAAAALGWAALLLLLVDPHLVSDAGFQLSSLATAGILAWATPFNAWLAARARWLPGWLVECLAVSLVAQAATLPVVLLSFGRLAIVSPLVNLGVVPLVAPAMAACAVALVGGLATLAGAPAAIATVLGLPAWFLLSVMVGIVQGAAGLPFASATIEPPWNGVAAGIAALAVIGAAAGRRLGVGARVRRIRAPPRRAAPLPASVRTGRHASTSRSARRSSRVVAVALATATMSLVLVAAHRPDGVTRITVLDVGQGDAILVEGSRGGRMLVDGGPDPDRLIVELDRRLPPWDRRLDVLILTHPHEDHVAGLALLLDRYRVGRVFEGGMRGPGPGLFGLGRGACASGRTAAGHARHRRPADGRRPPAPGSVAGPRPGAARAAGRRPRDQRRLDRPARRDRRPANPLDRRRRGRRRPDPRKAGHPEDRLPQGRPPRQRYRLHGRIPRRRPPVARGRLGRRRQPVRPPREVDPGAPPRGRSAGLPHRHRRLGPRLLCGRSDVGRGVRRSSRCGARATGGPDPRNGRANCRRPAADRRAAVQLRDTIERMTQSAHRPPA
jgi:competence protein ComEC